MTCLFYISIVLVFFFLCMMFITHNERLFLLRFNTWVKNMNVLPWQQSGARPHMATTTRVNHLLENITESLSYNTFSPVIFVDFLQAFDMLWQQGLLLKLHRLECPEAYLYWIKNYFTSRIHGN